MIRVFRKPSDHYDLGVPFTDLRFIVVRPKFAQDSFFVNHFFKATRLRKYAVLNSVHVICETGKVDQYQSAL